MSAAGERSAGRSAAQAREHLLDVLAPVVAATGCDLEDVTVAAAGRRSVVRVIVDTDGGVDLDAVAAVSRAVSEALDADTPRWQCVRRAVRAGGELAGCRPAADRPAALAACRRTASSACRSPIPRSPPGS